MAARDRETASRAAPARRGNLHAAVAGALGRTRAGAAAPPNNAQVERARIEEIENRLGHVRAQLDRVQAERSALEKSETAVQLELLSDREARRTQGGETARQELEDGVLGPAGGASSGKRNHGAAG